MPGAGDHRRAHRAVDRETRAPRKVFDTISDFAANAGIVLGGRPVKPDAVDLRWVGAMLFKNGVVEETGLAAGVLNHPATGVAWLANKIAPHDEQLNTGDVVLAGSFTRPTTAVAGDNLHADYGPLGTVSFVSSCQDHTMSRAAFTRPERFAAAEWDARVELAAAYRIFDHLGWSELIYNHLSLRVPGEPGSFSSTRSACTTARSRRRTWSRSMWTATSSATATGRSTRPASPSTARSTARCPTRIA